MKKFITILELNITKIIAAGGTAAKNAKNLALKVLSIFTNKYLKTIGLVALTVYISVAINQYYRPIQEVIHNGIVWTHGKSEPIADFLYEANGLLLNGKDFDRERSSKKVIYTAYSQVVMVNVIPVDLESATARTMAGRGTGWFYKIDGNDAYLITNHHVIDGAIGNDAVEIKVANGIEMWYYDVEVVGVDEISDIAVLKIQKKDN